VTVPDPRHDVAQGGFTLVEVMIALLVFAILASGGVALLAFSARAQAASGRALDDIAAINRTLSILAADLAQAQPRPVRDEAGTPLPALVGEADGGVQPMLRLVRGGWTNLDRQPRPGAQKVAYRVDGGVLQRLGYPQLDGAAPLPPAPLLDRVRGVRLRYRYAGAWSDRWDGAGGVPLPQALEIRIARDDGAEYRQLFLVGSGYTPRATNDGAG
jgi:type II secretion system protein J